MAQKMWGAQRGKMGETNPFIRSRHETGYRQLTLDSKHCLQMGVSPLHFVLRILQVSHAKGTRRL